MRAVKEPCPFCGTDNHLSVVRMAKAIATAEADEMEPVGWHLDAARAALMAMREPSDEVTREVGRAAWHSGSGQRPANVWIAGIDAILNEKDQ